MLIIAGTRRWTRYGPNYWFDHKAGVTYKTDDEIWFCNHVILIYQGVALCSVSKDDFWDLEKGPTDNQGFT